MLQEQLQATKDKDGLSAPRKAQQSATSLTGRSRKCLDGLQAEENRSSSTDSRLVSLCEALMESSVKTALCVPKSHHY